MKGIIFTTDLIPQVLNGTKTMTRRIMNPQPIDNVSNGVWYPKPDSDRAKHYANIEHFKKGMVIDFPRYKLNEVVYIKEIYGSGLDGRVEYKADWYPDFHKDCKWKSSMFMPEKYSRCKLKILDVRAERLQDISWPDAIAEGMKDPRKATIRIDNEHPLNPVKLFKNIWINLHGPDSWNLNPWVFVYTFERVE